MYSTLHGADPGTRSDARRVAAGSAALLGAQLAGLAAQLGSVLLIGRALGPTGLGQLSYATATVLVAWTVVELGLDTMLVRDAAGAEPAPGRLFGETLLAQVPLALLAIVALWLVGPFLPASAATVGALRTYSLSLVASAVAGAGEALVRSRERMALVGGVVAVSGACRLGGVALVLSRGGGVGALAALLLGVRVLEAALYTALVARLGVRAAQIGAARPSEALRRLRQTLPFAVAGMAGMLQLQGDVLVLGALAGERALGLYRAARGVLDVSRLMPNAVFGALYPASARLGRAPPARGVALFRRTLATATLLGAGGAAGATLLAPWLVERLYGARYAESVPVVQLVIWTLGPLVPNTVVAARLFAAGRAWRVAGVSAAGAGATLGLAALLTPAYGASGAAGAALLGELTMVALYTPDLVRELDAGRALRRAGLAARRFGPAAAIGGAIAAALSLAILPEAFRRYGEQRALSGTFGGAGPSLLSLVANLGLLAALLLVARPARTRR